MHHKQLQLLRHPQLAVPPYHRALNAVSLMGHEQLEGIQQGDNQLVDSRQEGNLVEEGSLVKEGSLVEGNLAEGNLAVVDSLAEDMRQVVEGTEEDTHDLHHDQLAVKIAPYQILHSFPLPCFPDPRITISF